MESARWVSRYVTKAEGDGYLMSSADRIRTERPLSFAQERLWFIEQLEPGTPVYNVAWRLEIHGALSLPLLQRGLDFIVERHEILRTSYGERGGVPFQCVHPEARVPTRVVDLRDRPATEWESICQAVLTQEAATTFRLDAVPMLRALVVRHSDQRCSVMLVSHHIAIDGWSRRIINRELSACYGAFEKRERPTLPDLPLQYAEFAVAQRDAMEHPAKRQALAYWTRQLEGLPESLPLPCDRLRSAEPDYRGASTPIRLPTSLVVLIDKLSRSLHATPFMILASAWTALLSRYAQEDDIALGFPIAGRMSPETEALVGFFVNTLVLRARFDTDPTFRGLVKQVRGTCLEAYDHQEVPFERIVAELQPHRERNQTPLFQVMLAFANLPNPSFSLGKARVQSLPFDRKVAKFDLSLNLHADAGEIGGTLEYRPELFDPWRIEQMARHFIQLLTEAVRSPDLRIHQINLFPPDEMETLRLRQVGPVLEAEETTLNGLFLDQVARMPRAIAIQDDRQALSYESLARRADRLASVLIDRGVTRGDRVALCLPESVDAIVALLGILRAGAAYVPLDPEDPAARLEAILERIDPRLVVTRRPWKDKLSALDRPLLCLEDVSDEALPTVSLRLPDVSPGDLAYVLHTSGSTGLPKGVAVAHRSVVNYTRSTLSALALPQGGTFSWIQPLATDISITTLFGALVGGGRILVIPPEERVDVEALQKRGRAERPDVLKLTPTHLAALIEAAADPSSLLPRELLILAGEALPWKLVHRVRELAPGLRIFNHYGPTEATVAATVYPVPDELGGAEVGFVPIGKPLHNVRTYVVDRHGQLCPVGVPGELWIGGGGLAQGYLFDEAATREAFTKNPFEASEDFLVYHTGDRVVMDVDGNLRFLDRFDDQVKIRGFRVEPVESRAAMLALAGIADAVVIPRQTGDSSAQLVAYYVAEDGAAVEPDQIGDALATKLPAHLIPSAFVPMSSLPYSRRGKLDRSALPPPELEEPRRLESGNAPASPLELGLVRIWEETLGHRPIGRNDVFFDLGGHSLLAVRLLSRIDAQLQIRIPIRVLFENPTIAGLAEFVENGEAGRAYDTTEGESSR